MQEETCLWRKVIDGNYTVQRGGWCSEEAQGPYGVCIWWNIRNGKRNFSTSSPSRLGMGPTFAFGMMIGADKLLSGLYLQSFI